MEVTSQPADSKATATKSIMLFTGADQRTGMFILKKVVVSSTDERNSG